MTGEGDSITLLSTGLLSLGLTALFATVLLESSDEKAISLPRRLLLREHHHRHTP